MKRYHQIGAIASMTAISAFMLPAAQSEGVVLETSVDAYKVGQIIAEGELIDLPIGEYISVISDQGEVFKIRERRTFGAADATRGEASQPSPIHVAVWDQRRADIGGTRGEDYERCVETAKDDPALDEADCARLADTPDDGAGLSVGLATMSNTLRPASPVRIDIEAAFSAVIRCQMGSIESPQDTKGLAIGPGGAKALHVRSQTRKRVPQRGGPVLPAPEQGGTYIISCLAISANTYELFQESVRDLNIETDLDFLARQFAAVRNVPVATASFTFEVSNP